MKLFKTSRTGRSGHYHYVYYDEANPSAPIQVSVAKGHTHPAVSRSMMAMNALGAQVPGFEQGQPVYQGEMVPGAITPSLQDVGFDTTQMPQGTLMAEDITILEMEGHIHDLLEEIPQIESIRPTISKEEDSDIVAVNTKLYEAAYQRQMESFTKADVCEKMFIGDQWVDNSGDELKRDKTKQTVLNAKARMTVNLIQPYIKIILGYFRQNRTDIKFIAVENSDELIADVLTAITKIEMNNCDFEFEENQVVEDQNIVGRGSFIVFTDYDEDVRGNIKVQRLPWRQVAFSEHIKMSASDAAFCASATYMTKEQMEAEWGDAVENLIPSLNSFESIFEQSLKSNNLSTVGPDAYDKEAKSFRVIDIYKNEYSKIYSIINDDGFVNTSEKKFSDMDQLEQFGFKMIDRKIKYVRHQTFAGEDILLNDEISEIDMLPIVPVYYDKRDDYFWGKVSLSIDLQRFLNKVFSKVADYVNKFVTNTHFYDEDTFPSSNSMMTEAVIADNLSADGALLKVNSISNIPQPMNNGILPPGIFNLMQQIADLILITYNLNQAFIGNTSSADSGVKVMQEKQQSIMGQETSYDNLNLSKKRLGKLILKNIVNNYTPDRVKRVLSGNSAKGMEFNFRGEPQTVETGLTPDELEDIGVRFADARESGEILKYDVAVTQSPHTPVTRMANYMMMIEAINAGHFPIPPDFIIEENPYLDNKAKKRGLAALQQARQIQEAQVSAEQNSQVERTLIAARGDIAKEMVKIAGKTSGGGEKVQ